MINNNFICALWHTKHNIGVINVKDHEIGFDLKKYKKINKNGYAKPPKVWPNSLNNKTMKTYLKTTIILMLLASFGTNAQKIYLKIGGTGVGGSLVIQGEVTTPAAYATQIEIFSVQEGTGGACDLSGNCSPVNQSELVLTAKVDKSFIPLRSALLQHNVFNLLLTQTSGGIENLLINLDNAIITGISISSGGDTPSVSISISAPKWQHKFVPTNATFGWDFLTNSTYTHP